MAKVVIGAFDTEKDALTAVNVYELAGHHSKNITILASQEQAESLDDMTDVTVKSDSPNEDEPAKATILDKLINAFSDTEEFELDTHEKLIDYGLPLEAAEECMEDVESGKIVVLADDELRMGHAPFTSKEERNESEMR